MKNPAGYIRIQLRQLLHTTIVYDSTPVPCYEGEGENVPYQILLREQNLNERNDKHSFNDDVTQLIEVVSTQTTNLRKHVDAIGEDVMNLMQPTVFTKGIADSADFQVVGLKRVSQNYIDEPTDEGTFYNRLLLRYTFLIVQK